jgi:hypothetical protein
MLINGHGFFVLQYFDLLDHQGIAALVVEMYLPVSRHNLPVTSSRQRARDYPAGNGPNDG